jgi:hydroxymethylpyrimidine pyrophosphatase-like HAD family hydrolase
MLRCLYVDLDGTLLGPGASLLRDAEGGFSLDAVRALQACHRAEVEVVIFSGRRQAQTMEDARLLGQTAYIFEVGTGLVIDGELSWLTGDLQPRDGKTIHDLIGESGAPDLLLDHYAGRLELHSPFHLGREVSHLMRGLVNTDEANQLLDGNGHGDLRLVDNGAISPKDSLPDIRRPHAYHLIPRESSKARAVATHMQARGYAPEECVALGDSREDVDVAQAVGRFFLVANADLPDAIPVNVEVTEGAMGEGFYEAVIRSLAESR